MTNIKFETSNEPAPIKWDEIKNLLESGVCVKTTVKDHADAVRIRNVGVQSLKRFIPIISNIKEENEQWVVRFWKKNA